MVYKLVHLLLLLTLFACSPSQTPSLVNPSPTTSAMANVTATKPVVTLAPAQLPLLIATIVSTEGKVYRVPDLRAYYIARGVWVSKKPQVISYVLTITRIQTNNGETTQERSDTRFDSIRRIVFGWMPNAYCERKLVRIEKRDGSLILLTFNRVDNILKKRLEERNPQGIQTSSFEGEVDLFDGVIQGQPLDLWEFVGAGNFSIIYCDIQSIEFELPVQ